jgi:hypothetical protein
MHFFATFAAQSSNGERNTTSIQPNGIKYPALRVNRYLLQGFLM